MQKLKTPLYAGFFLVAIFFLHLLVFLHTMIYKLSRYLILTVNKDRCMKKGKTIAIAAVNAAIVCGLAAGASFANAAETQEKCYGVVKAGKNDCSSAKHACAGQGATDAAAEDWVYVPQGLCMKLVGGTTETTTG